VYTQFWLYWRSMLVNLLWYTFPIQSFTSQATARDNKPHKLHKTVYLWSSNRCMEQVYGVMVFIATYNTISVISWRSVLLVEKTGLPEKTTDLSQVTDRFYNIMLYRVHLTMNGVQTLNCCDDRHWFHT